MREKTCPGPIIKQNEFFRGKSACIYPRISAHNIYLGIRMNYIGKLNLAFDILLVICCYVVFN